MEFIGFPKSAISTALSIGAGDYDKHFRCCIRPSSSSVAGNCRFRTGFALALVPLNQLLVFDHRQSITTVMTTEICSQITSSCTRYIFSFLPDCCYVMLSQQGILESFFSFHNM